MILNRLYRKYRVIFFFQKILADGDSRALCECDRRLMKTLKSAQPVSSSYPSEQCVATGGDSLECCLHDSFTWTAYNPFHSCCGQDGVKEIGSC